MEKEQNNFDEVQYIADVAKIRHVIINLLNKHNMVDKGALKNTVTEVNPYFGRITKNGAFGVEFSYGYPNAIFTPYGKIRTGVPPMSDNRGNYLDQENFFKDMQKKFGLVVAEPGFEKFGFEFGPYYAITRLPWKKNEKFPAKFQRVKGNFKEDSKRFEVFEEVRRASALLNQAEETIAELGVNAKKSKCIIGNEKNNLRGVMQIDDTEMGL